MAHYLYQNSDVNVFPQDAINIKTELEPAIYEVHASMAGYYLTRISDNFKMPAKIYGDVNTFANRIISTYTDRCSRHLNTGVLFSGIKGSGKTLQAKTIANNLVKNMPVIMVNTGFGPSSLSGFLNSIDTECCVIFDEFEKNYSTNNEEDRDSTAVQNGFLTMLDGTADSNKLFIFTCNDLSKVNDYLLNRPGRIFYHFKFDALSEDTLIAYANEKLNNQDYIDDLQIIKSRLDDAFTFDIMQSIIEESNRFNEAPIKFLKYMNLKSDSSERKYTVNVHTNNPNIVVLRQPTEMPWINFDDMNDYHIVSIWIGMTDFNHFKYHRKNEGTRIHDYARHTVEDLKKKNKEMKFNSDALYGDLINSGYPCFIQVSFYVRHNDLKYRNKNLTVECDMFDITYTPYKYNTFASPFAF
jgi:SpoVK/Ycf46/Vps4 family AAA+-type ATPase